MIPVSRDYKQFNMPRFNSFGRRSVSRPVRRGYNARTPTRGRSSSVRQQHSTGNTSQAVGESASLLDQTSNESFHSAVDVAPIDKSGQGPISAFKAKHPKAVEAAETTAKTAVYATVGAGSVGGLVLGVKADKREETNRNADLSDVEDSMGSEKRSGYSVIDMEKAAKAALKRAQAREKRVNDIAATAVATVAVTAICGLMYWGYSEWKRSANIAELNETKFKIAQVQLEIEQALAGSPEQDELIRKKEELVKVRDKIRTKLGINSEV